MHVRQPGAAVADVPRIAWLDPGANGAGAATSAAHRRGFTHALFAAPWPGVARDGGVLASAFPAESLAPLVSAARAENLLPMLDVRLDAIAARGTIPGAPFHQAAEAALLDPRRAVDAEAATATAGDAASFGAWWAAHLARWHGAGIAGFRLAGLDRLPAATLAAALAPIRNAVPDATLLLTMPGVPRSAWASLARLGFNYTLSSLPWWDGSAGWLWEEFLELGRIAPVLGAASLPGTPVFAEPHADLLAASLGAGWIAREPDTEEASAVNAALGAPGFGTAAAVLPAGPSAPLLAVLRTDGADPRFARHVALTVVAPPGAGAASATLDASILLAALGGRFGPFRTVLGMAAPPVPGGQISLPPGGAAVFAAEAFPALARSSRPALEDAQTAARAPRLAIENPSPAVDGGEFPVKRVAGEVVAVEADVVFDGHEKIAVAVAWRGPEAGGPWREVPMRPLGNDRWAGSFALSGLGRHHYRVIAWRDRFETFRDEVGKKHAAGVPVTLELQEGEGLLRAALTRAEGEAKSALARLAEEVAAAAEPDTKRLLLLGDATAELMAAADDRPFRVESREIPVDADRIGARFASWYEVFPRSMSDDAHRHGTFRDVERHLPRIRDMGFDVLYFPPIHPIGRKNRKGRNNTLAPAPDDPGSPYAIGSEEGGHDAIHPELGSFADFRHLIEAAARHGLEIAIDFAIQCSPDHPWLREHKGWFDWRPDGTIKYAENPPKKYEDIVNVDFYAPDAVPGLWQALAEVVLFWAGQGVRLFRVDNPHTKPFPFWEWLITTVRAQYPDALFLAEAFTRPKIMYRLGKIGFSQSYTYFTWRNTKRELIEYLTELADGPSRDFYRPHFFVNTPDINPIFLQTSGRPGFLIRAALAATLSGLWGVYNGFELCEGTPLPGREEYADSEKYQLRAWDWDRPGNIVPEITALNRIRHAHPALQTHTGVYFLPSDNEAVLVYMKTAADAHDTVLVAVSLDPNRAQETGWELPLWQFGLPDHASVPAADLLTGASFDWHGKYQHLTLTPDQPYRIWHIVHA